MSGTGEDGPVIGGEYLVNPVFLGAAQMTSAFDNGLENDFEDAEQTLQFDTQRLKPFAEEYEVLKSMEDNEQRILAKQWFFFKYERELKKQAKLEKQQKRKNRHSTSSQSVSNNKNGL
jgi:hypothetical protein